MMNNIEPVPIKEQNSANEVNVSFKDRIIKLLDGSTLIGRLLLFEDDVNNKDNLYHFHSPMELWYDYDGNLQMTKWNIFSDDIIFAIPINQIVNISKPEKNLGMTYANGFEPHDYADFYTNLKIPNQIH